VVATGIKEQRSAAVTSSTHAALRCAAQQRATQDMCERTQFEA